VRWQRRSATFDVDWSWEVRDGSGEMEQLWSEHLDGEFAAKDVKPR
jgi:hypothetical protein